MVKTVRDVVVVEFTTTFDFMLAMKYLDFKEIKPLWKFKIQGIDSSGFRNVKMCFRETKVSKPLIEKLIEYVSTYEKPVVGDEVIIHKSNGSFWKKGTVTDKITDSYHRVKISDTETVDMPIYEMQKVKPE